MGYGNDEFCSAIHTQEMMIAPQLQFNVAGYWTGRSICVTGCCGMIGSYLCELLVQQGASVIGTDNLERGKLTNLSSIIERDNFEFWEGDCADLDWMVTLFEECHIGTVFNLAARVAAIDFNAKHHAEMFHKNMLLQQIPLEAARIAGVERFAQTSTVCVFPHDAPIPTIEEAADVNNPEPTNAGYGFAKLMGEKMAQWYAKEYGMDIAITRFANAYAGERDYFDDLTSHVIPSLVKKNFEKDYVEIWGDGEQRREFLHAKDAATGIVLVTERYPMAEPVNVGCGSNISINELNDLIQDITGVTKPVIHTFEKPTGHQSRLVDNSKLKIVTGWTPEIELREGLTETISDYRRMTLH